MKSKCLCIGLLWVVGTLLGQEKINVVSSSSAAGEGLDLQAVGELFKEAETLEDFEQALNDPETGVNNLDLNEDGDVDYIRILEEAEGETRVIILQAALGEDEFQDVATIEVEKSAEDNVQMQVHGNAALYGPDVYYAPAVVHVHQWAMLGWLYRASWRPYRSVYYWGHYPRGWRRYRAVHVNVYRPRVARYTRHRSFTARRAPVVHVHKVRYTPRKSVLVKKRTVVKPARGRKTVVKKTTVKTPRKTVKRTQVVKPAAGRKTGAARKASAKRGAKRTAKAKRK